MRPLGGKPEANLKLLPKNPGLLEINGAIVESYCDTLEPFSLELIDIVSKRIVQEKFKGQGELYEILPDLTMVKYICSVNVLLDNTKNYYIPDKKIILYGYDTMMSHAEEYIKFYKGYGDCELLYRIKDKIFTEYVPERDTYVDHPNELLSSFLCYREAFI
jgi:hypothetical protein